MAVPAAGLVVITGAISPEHAWEEAERLGPVVGFLAAVLVLLPLTATAGPGAVLAVLLGVNIGPNLTYAGSLATLLWRRIVHRYEHDVGIGEFTRLGLISVPAALIPAVLALWGSLVVLGS